ncbi:oligopeptidase F [Anaerobacterium chartisolvens]|uniref:Oligopeptidase F n=1 Tax=Anaerobacterium chartisolvens TaxID=1297424 RepID=A0A369BHW3_9FIRM|nr:oligoendopeptidase F [Anaerobacterium chartisolvens]RCX21001.1 oligopeptidase F [Anaerobacterium chartisolvens]
MQQTKTNKLPKREEIDGQYKWRLEDIYDSIDKWEQDFKTVKRLSGEIVSCKGTLGETTDRLLACLTLCDELTSLNDRLFVYSRMKRDENNADAVYQALTERASALSTEVYAAISFIVPEIISIPEDTLKEFMDSNKGLWVYRHYINELLRQKKHILSDEQEQLLALASEPLHASHDIFSMFNNADIKFPFIKDEEGNEVELTKGRYVRLLESKDRRVREDAFHAMYSSYKKNINTLAASFSGNVKKNRFYTTVRKYGSSLEASLDSDNITTDIYDNLIKTVNSNLHLLHRYLRLRKKALKLEELHMYDLYVPIVEEPEKSIPYSDALSMVQKGLMPLGEEYAGYLKQGFDTGWIDVYENEGKTGGAYSWGTYGTHPYVLLNYQGTINDVYTVAHEMGHALHSFYTNKTQPYIYSEYKIFVAEVASTVNESLLMRHMLANTRDNREKAYLLNHYLEEFRGTVFRQVMFAEFEKLVHEKAEQGEALTTEMLSETYRGLNMKYFGNEVVVDQDIDIEWARIPHFYTSFYVYKYATGFSAATSLSRQILEEGGPAVSRYISFLESGGSDYPIELLKRAGVDLSTPQPIQDALNVFEEILNELEGII